MADGLLNALILHRAETRAQVEALLDEASTLHKVVDWYVQLFQVLPVPYLVLDEMGLIVEMNTAAARALDIRGDRSRKRPLLTFLHRDDVKLFFSHLRRCVHGAASTEIRLRPGRGHELRPVRMITRRLARSRLHTNTHSHHYCTVLWDIAEDRRRDERLRENEARYREIVETASEGICVVNEENEIQFANQRFAGMLGRTIEELLGVNAIDLVAPSEADDARAAFEQRESGPAGQSEQRLVRADGSQLLTSVSTTVLRDRDGHFQGMLRMYTDATVRQHFAEARKIMVRELVAAQERERARVARELHDQMGQHVVALTLGLARLATIQHPHPDATAVLEQLRGVADLLGRDVHTLAMELRPSALDHLGLAVALTSYTESVAERSKLDIDVHCDCLDGLQLNTAIETGIYRIAQEALTNVVKHAQAKRVSVILECRANTLHLIIEDDGVGFDQFSRPSPSKLGLSGMRERVALLGGTLTIETSPGNGTSVFARIPITFPELDDHEQTPTVVAG